MQEVLFLVWFLGVCVTILYFNGTFIDAMITTSLFIAFGLWLGKLLDLLEERTGEDNEKQDENLQKQSSEEESEVDEV